jgi:hypothetical protein
MRPTGGRPAAGDDDDEKVTAAAPAPLPANRIFPTTQAPFPTNNQQSCLLPRLRLRSQTA